MSVPTHAPAHRLLQLLRRKELSAVELVQAFCNQADQVEDSIHAFLSLHRDSALEEAATWDQKRSMSEDLPPLAGLPVALKDNLCVKGSITTCASRMLEQFRPPYSATVVDRLQKAGCIVLGKTNMDEFAMGSSTENSAFQKTQNPWDLSAIPGGSSGGSAAAIAAGEAPVALGSDTGGSIRQPAALCGVVGLKPTYGRVSRYGLVAFASSLDQIGPITHDVTDCAIILNIIAGHDPRDSTSLPHPVPNYEEHLIADLTGMRIGMPKEYFVSGLEKQVEERIRQAAIVLQDLGAVVEETSLPHTEYAIATYYVIATAEASSNLARYDGVGYGYRPPETSNIVDMYENAREASLGEEVKRRIMLGTYVLSQGYYEDYYGQALKVRTLIADDFNRAFEQFDALLTPTTPTVAFKLGEKTDDPLQMYLSDVFTSSANLAGIPGISIPCGFDPSGLPVGLQVLGKPLEEATVLRIAYAYEQGTEWHKHPCLIPRESNQGVGK